jgi:citrate synthase
MASRQQMTAREAARELGVSLPTLYAYVSRGLIRSEPSAKSTRQRLYRREDIEMLKNRKEVRRNPAQAGERTLSWGMPVLESSLTLISDGRLYYRGLDAAELAATRTVEEVASLMWQGEVRADCGELFERAAARVSASSAARVKLPDMAPIERFRAILPIAAGEDLAAYDLSQPALEETAARIVVLLTGVAAGNPSARGGMARVLASAWAPDVPGAAETLRTALILGVDHELAVSSFTARCVASAGSTLYAVVEAALCALRGRKHGGLTEQAEELLREAATVRRVPGVLASRLKRGEPIPGFGHRLYPTGDPRAQALLRFLMRHYADSPAIAPARSMMGEMRKVSGRLMPNIDFALAVLTQTLRLPAGSAVTIFALARTIGWIGHAMEQYRIDSMIRPRARYVGAAPIAKQGRIGGIRPSRNQ